MRTTHPSIVSMRRARGFSLIEVMVAMVIGLVLIAGAMQVYVNSRNTYAINESAARLQETARYAFSVLEPDIRMAGYWGLAKDSALISGRQPQPTAAVPAPTVISDLCGYNYLSDLSTPVQGRNNSYRLGVVPITNCDPFNNNTRPTADTLTVRHASLVAGAPSAALFQLCTNRSGLGSTLGLNVTPCAAPNQLSNLIVNGYYISNDSNLNSGGAGIPSLRRKSLVAGPAFQEEEVIEGVEDMQVQFGIDPAVAPATPIAGVPLPHCGIARFYINPGGAMPAGTVQPQIVTVRVWLLIRSDVRENGFIDNTVYTYADRTTGLTSDLTLATSAGRRYRPQGNLQQEPFRRLLVSRTFQLRNTQALDSLATSAANPCP